MALSSLSSSSSFPPSHLSDAVANYYSFILPSADEDAIPPIAHPLPQYHNKGKRKMSQIFDEAQARAETAPIETPGPGVSTHLTLHFAPPPTFNHTNTTTALALSSFPMSSTQPFHTQCDKVTGKMPHFFDFFAPEGKPIPVDTTRLPTPEFGVSTELSLLHFAGPPQKTAVVSPRYSAPAPRDVVLPSNPPALPEDRWEIKKVLKKSDVDDSSRLLLSKVNVQEHILPRVTGNLPGRGLDEGEGVEVAVWDMDTGSEHVLVLKKWKPGSFVLMKNWMSEFVRRRGLEKNDVIGLRWDDGSSRLEFTVLKKN